MSDLVVPRDTIALTDAGSYRVDEYTLLRLDGTRIDAINRAMTALMQMNPEFEFSKQDDIIHGGFTIYWRRRKNHG